MPKFSFSNFPTLQVLTKEEVSTVHNAALDLLEKVGMIIHNDEALKLLNDAGATVNFDERLVRFPSDLVTEAVKKAPSTITLYGRERRHDIVLEGNRSHFCPGSSAIRIYEAESKRFRDPTSQDAVDLARVTDALEYVDTQCAAIVVYDVPEVIRDRYRYYLWLKNTSKHVMVSSFHVESPHDIRALAAVIAGSEEELDRKPFVSSIVCPSPPFKWSELTCQNLLDYAKYSIPTIILPMPQINATGPATIAANLVQCIAEGLSGVVMAQLVKPGAPIIFGSDASLFDQRTAVSCGSIESILISCAAAQMGKFYGLPTHTYMGSSVSKTLDAQDGLESASGIILGTLSGINLMSGPGLITFGLAQCLEKIVIDNEICGMAYRFAKLININATTIAEELFEKIGPGGHFLAEKHTLEWFRKEQFMPTRVIDRLDPNRWKAEGSKDIVQRAKEKVREILANHTPKPLPSDIEKELDNVMKGIARRYNIKTLPLGP